MKRPRSSEDGGHEGAGMMRWLLTYADMITLLLALFIVLYSQSQINAAKFEAVAAAVRAALGGASERPAPVPTPASVGRLPIEGSLRVAPGSPPAVTLEQQMAQFLDAIRRAGLQESTRVLRENAGIVIRLPDDILFETGSADLRPDALPTVVRLAGIINQVHGTAVRVEGFTDSRPIHTPQFPSNWELSVARALSVVQALIASGVAPERLSAAGFGPYHPVATNATPEGRAQNRRVEILVTRELVRP